LGKHGRKRSNVWKYDGASVQAGKGNDLLALHPTAKPADLVMDAQRDSSRRGGIVLGSIAGSGTTLMAFERTGRIFRGIELDRSGRPAMAGSDGSRCGVCIRRRALPRD